MFLCGWCAGGVHETQAPDVRTKAVFVSAYSLGRHVGDSANPGRAHRLALRHHAADSKVGYFELPLRINKNVRGLQIPGYFLCEIWKGKTIDERKV